MKTTYIKTSTHLNVISKWKQYNIIHLKNHFSNQILEFEVKNLHKEISTLKNNLINLLKSNDKNKHSKVLMSMIYFETLFNLLKEQKVLKDTSHSIKDILKNPTSRKLLDITFINEEFENSHQVLIPKINLKGLKLDDIFPIDLSVLKSEIEDLKKLMLQINKYFNTHYNGNEGLKRWEIFKKINESVINQKSFIYQFNNSFFELKDFLDASKTAYSKVMDKIHTKIGHLFQIDFKNFKSERKNNYQKVAAFKKALEVILLRVFNYAKSVYFEKQLVYISHTKKDSDFKYYPSCLNYNKLFDVIKVDKNDNIVDLIDVKINKPTKISNNQDWIKAMVIDINLRLEINPNELKKLFSHLEENWEKYQNETHLIFNPNLKNELKNGYIQNEFFDYLNSTFDNFKDTFDDIYDFKDNY